MFELTKDHPIHNGHYIHAKTDSNDHADYIIFQNNCNRHTNQHKCIMKSQFSHKIR